MTKLLQMPSNQKRLADFFISGANSMIFPRCSGETHFTAFRNFLGM